MKRLWGVLTVAIFALTGCGDEGPVGPGSLTGIVESELSTAVGAVVVDLDGVGFVGVQALGTARAVLVGALDIDTHRIIFLATQAGPIRFTVDVEDRSVANLNLTVVEAAGLDNLPIASTDGITARMIR